MESCWLIHQSTLHRDLAAHAQTSKLPHFKCFIYQRRKILHLSYLYPTLRRTLLDHKSVQESSTQKEQKKVMTQVPVHAKALSQRPLEMTESRGYPERIISCLGLWRYIFMYVNIVIPPIHSTTLKIMIILVPDDLGTVGQSCSAHSVWYSSWEHKLWCWTTGCRSWVHQDLLGVYG